MNVVLIIAGFYLLFLAMVMNTENFKSLLIFRLTPLGLGAIILLSKAKPLLEAIGQ